MGDDLLIINITKTHKSRINETDFENLGFGEVFSYHMFSMALLHRQKVKTMGSIERRGN